MDWVDEQVGGEEEEVGTAEASQKMVENIPHRPRFRISIFQLRTHSILAAKMAAENFLKGPGICVFFQRHL